MYPVATKYGYCQSLTLTPDSELRFVSRPAPPDKKKGGVNARLGLAPIAIGTPSARSVGGDLAVETNFTARKNTPKKQVGYGQLPEKQSMFTARARRSVRWGAASVEREFGIENCYFATLSLPGSSDLAVFTLALWSSWLVDCLNKWLARNCVWIDGECYRVSTWEEQKRGALHLHLLIVAESPEFIAKLQAYYVSLLEKLSDSTGVDLFERKNGGSWRGRVDSLVKVGKKRGVWVNGKCRVIELMCDVKRVQKSVTAYLSKYMSKGSCRSGHGPARWWSMSNSVRVLMAKYTVKLPLPRTDFQGASVVDEFVRGAFETCRLYAECLRNIGRETEFRTGYIAWDDYETLRGLISAIGETIMGHLNQLGHVRGASELRFECAMQQIRAAIEKKRVDSDFYAELALDRVMNGRFSEQLASAKAGVHRDYVKRNELREMRKQLDDVKVNVIVNQKVNAIVNDKRIASVIQLWNSPEYNDRLQVAKRRLNV